MKWFKRFLVIIEDPENVFNVFHTLHDAIISRSTKAATRFRRQALDKTAEELLEIAKEYVELKVVRA